MSFLTNIKTADDLEQEKIDAKNAAREYELLRLLSSTDHNVLPDYDRPNDHIIAQRQAWRNEIRQIRGDAVKPSAKPDKLN